MAGARKTDADIIEKHACICCGNQNKKEFYTSINESHKNTNGKLPWCKSCVEKQFNNYLNKYGDGKLAIYFLCRKFDIYFSISAYEGAEKNSVKTGWTIIQSYFKQINSFRDANNYGVCFDDTVDILEDSNKYNNINIESNFEVTEEIIRFFGGNLNPEEYEYLSEKLDEYMNTYECETPVMEELLKQAAFESLEIRNKRMRREDVSKNLKNLQDLLGSANIKPNQETGANATEQATFGTLLKKWENEEPVPEPDDEWKDVDGIGKYIRVWFLGHLCKMMGITNDYAKEYEEEMANLRVSLPSDNSSDEEMDEGD
jgi:hypothetical protein